MVFFKRILLVLLLAVVAVPVLQARFHFSAEAGLNGAFSTAPRPLLTWDALRNNTFQPALEQYLEDRIGFRPYLIRLRNQLAYSVFHITRSGDIVAGLHGVLFQTAPIASYAGQDRLDEAEVRFRMRRLRAVQRELARHHVKLLLVLAPSKARFQPEDLPEYLRPAPATRTNYDLFTAAMRADSVELLDMVPVFAHWKATAPYPLFPTAGTHWSGYGATLAADTLLRRLEQLGGLRFPTVRTVGPPRLVHAPDSARGTDNDIAGPLNLLKQELPKPFAYRRLAFDLPGPGQVRPPALFVGDSFTWGLMLFSPYLQREFSDDTRIWYYNNVVHQPDSVYHDTGERVPNLNLRQQLESRRFIVLLLTEHNLKEQEFGFTEQVYRLYHPLTPADNAAIDRLAHQLAQKVKWEDQTKDLQGFATQTHARALALYERGQRP